MIYLETRRQKEKDRCSASFVGGQREILETEKSF